MRHAKGSTQAGSAELQKPDGQWRRELTRERYNVLRRGLHRVVVVGGGFAGLEAVRGLRAADAEVTLVDRRNFHLFQPLLYQVASGALSPGEIVCPLRGILARQRNARVVLAEVAAIDLAGRRVRLRGQAGQARMNLPMTT